MAEAEKTAFESAKKGLVRIIRGVHTAVNGYTKDDVDQYDVKSGIVGANLSRIRSKLEEFTEVIDGVIDDVENAELENAIKKERLDELTVLKNEAVKQVKDNEREVKVKALSFVTQAPLAVAAAPPGGAPPDVGLAAAVTVGEVAGKKLARFNVMKRQIKVKSRDLVKLSTAHTKPDDMKEGDIREKLQESKEWLKKVEEVQKTVDTFELEAALLEANVEAEAVHPVLGGGEAHLSQSGLQPVDVVRLF